MIRWVYNFLGFLLWDCLVGRQEEPTEENIISNYVGFTDRSIEWICPDDKKTSLGKTKMYMHFYENSLGKRYIKYTFEGYKSTGTWHRDYMINNNETIALQYIDAELFPESFFKKKEDGWYFNGYDTAKGKFIKYQNFENKEKEFPKIEKDGNVTTVDFSRKS